MVEARGPAKQSKQTAVGEWCHGTMVVTIGALLARNTPDVDVFENLTKILRVRPFHLHTAAAKES